MTGGARRIARDWLPPELLRRLSGENAASPIFDDHYSSWDDAESAALGYDAPSILAQVTAATNLVLRGEAAFERDGVTFDKAETRWPIAASLLLAASRCEGRLRVLDFGGALGSTYWQHRKILSHLDLTWGVVEQADYVYAGAQFADDRLSFFNTVEEFRASGEPDIILLSSVLQYLSKPYGVLQSLASTPAGYLVIDRTPMSALDRDIAAVQKVPKHIYDASYPSWIFSRERMKVSLPGWSLLEEFPGIEPRMRTSRGVPFDWQGFLLERTIR